MTNKEKILEDLTELLVSGTATSQDEICSALESMGHEMNQSKVSRLLRKVGAVKAKNEDGQIVYRLPKEPAPPTPNSQLERLILNITANENTVVVHTSPGSASLIARMIDHHRERLEVLGTIAGDDTIFVLPCKTDNIQAVLQAVKNILLNY